MQLCMFISRIAARPRENDCEGNEEVDDRFKRQHLVPLCISRTPANNNKIRTPWFGGEAVDSPGETLTI